MNLKDVGDKYKAAVNEGRWMQIVHPATAEVIGEDTGRIARIRLLHKDSDTVVKINEQIINDMAIRYQRTGKNLHADALKQREVSILVAATVEWENIDWDEQENIPCTPNWAKKVYLALPWLRAQVDSYTSNAMNYGGEGESALASDSDAFFEEQEKNLQAGASGDSAFSGR
jgi:hypothetical protein